MIFNHDIDYTLCDYLVQQLDKMYKMANIEEHIEQVKCHYEIYILDGTRYADITFTINDKYKLQLLIYDEVEHYNLF